MICLTDAFGFDHIIREWSQDFEIELPWFKPWCNQRMHWRQESKLKREQKRAVRLGLEEQGIVVPLPCTIILQRVTHRGSIDPSNLTNCTKFVQDEIARWLGLKDDHAPGMRWLYGQQKTSRKGFIGVRVTIVRDKPRVDG